MSIVEPSVLELLQHADSRYTLPLIDTKDMKPLKAAVEEINRGLITYDRPAEEEEQA